MKSHRRTDSPRSRHKTFIGVRQMKIAAIVLLALSSFALGQQLQLTTRILAKDLTDPMKMAIADDGKVFITERNGNLKLFNPATNTTTLLKKFPVRWFADARAEGGLLGMA